MTSCEKRKRILRELEDAPVSPLRKRPRRGARIRLWQDGKAEYVIVRKNNTAFGIKHNVDRLPSEK